MPSSVPSHAHAGRPARLGALLLAVLLGVLPAAAAGQSATAPVPPAQAAVQSAQAAGEQASTPADKPPSNFKWSWGNTLTYGLGFRVADPDKRIIGVAAGGTAFSVNGDDGNQNYKKGLFTNAAKITSEFEFSYKQRRRLRPRLRLLRLRERERRPGAHAAVGRGQGPRRRAARSSATPSCGTASRPGRIPAKSAAAGRSSTGARAPSSRAASTPSTRSTSAPCACPVPNCATPCCRWAPSSSASSRPPTRRSRASTSTPGKRPRSTRSAATSARPTWPAPGASEGHARLRLRARHGGRRPRAAAADVQPGRRRRAEAQRRPSRPATTGSTAWRSARLRPGAGRHRVRPLLPELPQPPAAASWRRPGTAERAVRAATTPRPRDYFLVYPEDIKLFGAQLQHPARPDGHRAAGRGRRTAGTCRCRWTTSSCSTRR